MRKPEPVPTHDTPAETLSVDEAVAETIEAHRRLKEPAVIDRAGRVVWLAPEQIAPRPLPGDDEPLPEDIEI